MKAIDILAATITGIRSRADKSLSFSVVTPEMTAEQAAALLALHGIAARVLLVPTETAVTEQVTVKSEHGTRTPSQRLRSIIMAHWMQLPVDERGDSEAFYRQRMDGICERYKDANLQ